MKIEDQFRVDVPVDEAWRVLLDLERIAPCLPGAQLQEIEGDEYRGIVKVKVGPITAQYKGAAQDRARSTRRRTRWCSARGPRHARAGQRVGDDHSRRSSPTATARACDIDTDLTITGKVAQFGRGVMADVSSKLLGQFVENLERDVLVRDRPRAMPSRERDRRRPTRRPPSRCAGSPRRGRAAGTGPSSVRARSTRPKPSRSTCSTVGGTPSSSAVAPIVGRARRAARAAFAARSGASAAAHADRRSG